MNFESFKQTTYPYKDLSFGFDVRAQAKTDESQVNEILQQLREGKSIRLPFISYDGVTIDGRHGVEALRRFIGGDNPLIPVFMFPWKYSALSVKQQGAVQVWALIENISKSTYRRFATFEDEYLQVKKLLREEWSIEEVKDAFRGKLPNERITALIQKATKAHHNEVVAQARELIAKNPKVNPKTAIRASGGDPKDMGLARAVTSKRRGGTSDGKLRAHKFAAKMARVPKDIQKHAQLAMDMWRDSQDGLTGITSARWLIELKKLQEKRDVINDAVDEVVRRALAEMGLTSDALETKKRKAATAGR